MVSNKSYLGCSPDNANCRARLEPANAIHTDTVSALKSSIDDGGCVLGNEQYVDPTVLAQDIEGNVVEMASKENVDGRVAQSQPVDVQLVQPCRQGRPGEA